METIANDITPQRLGSIVKSSGVRKSKRKKGNFYNYYTEGYRVNRQWRSYSIDYVKELRLSLMTENERNNFEQRRSQALETIAETLTQKGLVFEKDGDEITIYLAQKVGA